MKANYVLPDEGDPLFDRIDYIELPRHECAPLVEQYVVMFTFCQLPKKTKKRQNKILVFYGYTGLFIFFIFLNY